jgi:hypothetical protein
MIEAHAPYRGEVVYLFAFDLAYDTRRAEISTLLGQPLAQFNVDPSKRAPRQLSFYRPRMVTLPPLEERGPNGYVSIQRMVKLLPVGAVSITFRIPFEVREIQHLNAYHHPAFFSPLEEATRLAEAVQKELTGYFIRPVQNLQEEDYTVFCLENPLPGGHAGMAKTESWLESNRREVAAVLTQEPNTDYLSKQEAEESTTLALSYYQHDLLVVDWDAALLVDERKNFPETLYLLELANLQLAELKAYDRILDDAMERSYRDLSSGRLSSRRDTLRSLRELRVDLARFSDELSNITKFFGDWHLARIYQAISARFHLADWQHSLNEKLQTLDDLYAILNQDRINGWMLALEITIVLLFIIDLVILILGLRGHP